MKHIIFLSLFSLFACGVPQVNVPNTAPVTIIKDTCANRTYVAEAQETYYFINKDDPYYIKETNTVYFTDSSVVVKNIVYPYVDNSTILKPEEATNAYTRIKYHRTENSLQIGRLILYKEVPSLKDAPQKGKFYGANELIVRKGYSLSYISKMYNIPVDELIQLNNLSPDKPLQIGQVIKLY